MIPALLLVAMGLASGGLFGACSWALLNHYRRLPSGFEDLPELLSADGWEPVGFNGMQNKSLGMAVTRWGAVRLDGLEVCDANPSVARLFARAHANLVRQELADRTIRALLEG